jgi:phage terminase large subunit-like protein
MMRPADPRVVCSLYTAPPDADPFALDTIKLANPSLGVFQNPAEVLAMAADGKRMPAREAAAFRRLVLNMRGEASSPFAMPAQWQACAGAPMDLKGRDVFAGLDLSATTDLTALVLIGHDIATGIWHVQPTFWLPADGLFDKARTDKIP